MRLILTLIFIIGCATESEQVKSAKSGAQRAYLEAKELVDEGQYRLATEQLSILRTEFPYSYFATEAELLQADIFYKQENYVDAAGAYAVFRDFHPRHKRGDYVLWQIANSYSQLIPETFDRDLSGGHEAIKYYQLVIKHYPLSDYAKKAKTRIEEVKEMFIKKEKSIADFYFKTKAYPSAEYRYLQILKSFRSRQALRDHAGVRLLKSAYLQKKYKECLNYSSRFVRTLSTKARADFERASQDCKEAI